MITKVQFAERFQQSINFVGTDKDRAESILYTRYEAADTNGDKKIEYGELETHLRRINGIDQFKRELLEADELLHVAVLNQKAGWLRDALSAGADVNGLHRDGKTALRRAQSWMFPAGVEILLEAGAKEET